MSNLNQENCNDICGGKKTAMCSVFIQLGMAFMKSKGPIEDNGKTVPTAYVWLLVHKQIFGIQHFV